MKKKKTKKATNELFAAIENGSYEEVKSIFKQYKHNKQELGKLVNERNEFGTNALGQAFLEKLKFKDDFLKIVKLFVLCKEFNVNAYLNNKTEMNCLKDPPSEIGGYNVLHMALKPEMGEEFGAQILGLLATRNDHFGWVNTDVSCNFKYQCLNPTHHMHSPLTLAKTSKSPHQDQLSALQKRQTVEIENDDSSGDSDTEGTRAYDYKKHLQELTQRIDERSGTVKKKTNLPEPKIYESTNGGEDVIIPHFHGVPFIDGQYTNEQRREIFKKIKQFNEQSLQLLRAPQGGGAAGPSTQTGGAAGREHDPEDNNVISAFGSIHSRTSTVSCGIENLHHMSQLRDFRQLQRVDKLLNEYLSHCFKTNKEVFLEAVKTYVYKFKEEDSQKNFWQALADIEKPSPEIVQYRFPFISTSKAPDHAVKFAWGHNVEDLDKGEEPLHPYYKGGYPAHRLAGFVYVTLHSARDINLLKDHQLVDMPSLLVTGDIKTSQQAREDYINYQNEVTFLGGINHANVVAIIPLIYPNFTKDFQENYHDLVWDIQNAHLNKNGKPAGGKNKPDNLFSKVQKNFKKLTATDFPNCYDKHSSITSYGKLLMPGFVKLAADLAMAVAKTQGKKLCYQFNDELYQYLSTYVREGNTHFSGAQLQINDLLKNPPSKKEQAAPKRHEDDEDDYENEPEGFVDGKALFNHQEASSWHKYWYKYSKSAMNELLKLRVESAGISDDTQIISLPFSFDGSIRSAAKLANKIGSQLLENKALVVLNLYNKHWVGLAVDTNSDKVTITYMDSEQTVIPEELKTQLSDAINKAKPQSTISVIEANLELQKYNNCGPEVIENFIAYLTGHRLPQDDAIIAHSALLEESAMLIGAID